MVKFGTLLSYQKVFTFSKEADNEHLLLDLKAGRRRKILHLRPFYLAIRAWNDHDKLTDTSTFDCSIMSTSISAVCFCVDDSFSERR